MGSGDAGGTPGRAGRWERGEAEGWCPRGRAQAAARPSPTPRRAEAPLPSPAVPPLPGGAPRPGSAGRPAARPSPAGPSEERGAEPGGEWAEKMQCLPVAFQLVLVLVLVLCSQGTELCPSAFCECSDWDDYRITCRDIHFIPSLPEHTQTL